MSHSDWFFLFMIAIIAVPYLGGPLLILLTFKLRCPTEVLYFEADTLRLPRDVSQYLEPARQEVMDLEFRPVAYFCVPDFAPNAQSINVLLINDRTKEAAMVNCLYGAIEGGPTLIKTKYVEFVTRFRDGVQVQTNNSSELSSFRPEPGEHTIQFWETQNIAEVYRRHQKICERLGTAPPTCRLTDEFGGDVEQFLQMAVLKEPLEYQVQLGLLRRVPEGYRPTLRGAFVLAWQEMWPWEYGRKQIRRREAKQWLQEIAA